jgi:P-type E1-E2 ATPase
MDDNVKNKPRVQTVSLMEELGSITHVFTDKTGTLTLNLMQLRCVNFSIKHHKATKITRIMIRHVFRCYTDVLPLVQQFMENKGFGRVMDLLFIREKCYI